MMGSYSRLLLNNFIKGLRGFLSIIWLVAVVSFLIVLSLNIVLLVWGTSIVGPWTLGGVPPSTNIIVTFDRDMNCSSVEENLVISPKIQGTFNWHGNTMIFIPESALNYSTTYLFKINRGARDLYGNMLINDHEWYFTTETRSTNTFPPIVMSSSPEGTTSPSGVITLTFSSPMDKRSVRDGFSYTDGTRILTKDDGAFYWYGNTMVFVPHYDFAQSTVYNVTLDGNMVKDLKGKMLDGDRDGISEGAPFDDYKWSFTSYLPENTTSPIITGKGPMIPQAPRDAIFIIIPQPVVLFFINGYSLLAWYIFVVVTLVASFLLMMVKEGRSTLSAFSQALFSFQAQIKSNSSAIVVAQLFCALLFFHTVYFVILYLLNINIHIPNIGGGAVSALMYYLARASVIEEIVARMLFIGVPLLFFDLLTKRKKKTINYFKGGNFDIDLAAIVLILFSSAMFAAAHVFSWDYYKLAPTFVAGLAFGYLFLKKGIHTSILLHFAFNYLSISLSVFHSIAIDIALVILVIGWSLVGFGLFIHYITSIIRLFTVKGREKYGSYSREKAKKSVQHLRYQERGLSPMFGYRCPNCGWSQARYSNGHFICSKCGFKT